MTEIRQKKIKIELFNDHFQNYKRYQKLNKFILKGGRIENILYSNFICYYICNANSLLKNIFRYEKINLYIISN